MQGRVTELSVISKTSAQIYTHIETKKWRLPPPRSASSNRYPPPPPLYWLLSTIPESIVRLLRCFFSPPQRSPATAIAISAPWFLPASPPARLLRPSQSSWKKARKSASFAGSLRLWTLKGELMRG